MKRDWYNPYLIWKSKSTSNAFFISKHEAIIEILSLLDWVEFDMECNDRPTFFLLVSYTLVQTNLWCFCSPLFVCPIITFPGLSYRLRNDVKNYTCCDTIPREEPLSKTEIIDTFEVDIKWNSSFYVLSRWCKVLLKWF